MGWKGKLGDKMMNLQPLTTIDIRIFRGRIWKFCFKIWNHKPPSHNTQKCMNHRDVDPTWHVQEIQWRFGGFSGVFWELDCMRRAALSMCRALPVHRTH